MTIRDRALTAASAALAVALLGLLFVSAERSHTQANRCRAALVAAEQLQHATLTQEDAEAAIPAVDDPAWSVVDYVTATKRATVAIDATTYAQNHYREARAQCPK